ncbi:hypothetical protein PUNSTDRAFT_135128 [Punctularia strigosozonata HHB-11173 SS5]|uniref:uncharacterized protein n=1 Tax=Punctularia strigosozonata (strain HHB-11173) TaxID=741275 RepID=UPI000441833E|nr:uncharacterized protein PUNSTDRAFT_135128 [Punctularia strigosozonata HHB-11173 SS5]EIN07605.1 hypothetical protein PUNSTDRAFT_135128 [Punctularia strigosozonata HHB-11173 SS5]
MLHRSPRFAGQVPASPTIPSYSLLDPDSTTARPYSHADPNIFTGFEGHSGGFATTPQLALYAAQQASLARMRANAPVLSENILGLPRAPAVAFSMAIANDALDRQPVDADESDESDNDDDDDANNANNANNANADNIDNTAVGDDGNDEDNDIDFNPTPGGGDGSGGDDGNTEEAAGEVPTHLKEALLL